jgi:hypothetical protein
VMAFLPLGKFGLAGEAMLGCLPARQDVYAPHHCCRLWRGPHTGSQGLGPHPTRACARHRRWRTIIVDLEAGKPTAQLGKALAAAKAAGMCVVDTAEIVIESRPKAAP